VSVTPRGPVRVTYILEHTRILTADDPDPTVRTSAIAEELLWALDTGTLSIKAQRLTGNPSHVDRNALALPQDRSQMKRSAQGRRCWTHPT
jgi:hypothetical protein